MSPVRLKFQALVAETLADPTTGHGYKAMKLDFGEGVEVTLQKDNAQFVVWLRPADHPTPCYRQIGRFKIGHRGDPPDRLGYAVLDGACRAIAAWEPTLADDAHAQLFEAHSGHGSTVASWSLSGKPALERLAVRSGLKPACRYLVRPDEAGRITEQARVDGLFTCVTEARAFIEKFCGEGVKQGATTLVHVGRTDQAAAIAADAERTMMEATARGERVNAAQVRALGAALGYPPCCVEAFLPVRDLAAGAIRFHALKRTTGRVDVLLNNMVEGRALVSHSLCRYDCASSLHYARALFQEFHRIDARSAGEVMQGLSGLVVAFCTGESLRLAPVTSSDSGPYTFEGVEEIGSGPGIELWRGLLADADGLETLDGEVRILRGSDEIARLSSPPEDVQIRLFAP